MNITIIYIILFVIYFISLYFVVEKYVNNSMEFVKPEKFYKIDRTSYRNFFNLNSMFYSDDYNNFGYNKEGYNRDGYNKEGYNRYGYDLNGYNNEGYNRYGFDVNGLNKNKYNQAGYKLDTQTNKYLNKMGYDKDGYNKEGFDKYNYDKYGYNKNGINKYGFDMSGNNIKLKPNVYQIANKQFISFPFNILDETIIEERKMFINKQLVIEDELEDEYKRLLENDNNMYRKKN